TRHGPDGRHRNGLRWVLTGATGGGSRWPGSGGPAGRGVLVALRHLDLVVLTCDRQPSTSKRDHRRRNRGTEPHGQGLRRGGRLTIAWKISEINEKPVEGIVTDGPQRTQGPLQ